MFPAQSGPGPPRGRPRPDCEVHAFFLKFELSIQSPPRLFSPIPQPALSPMFALARPGAGHGSTLARRRVGLAPAPLALGLVPLRGTTMSAHGVAKQRGDDMQIPSRRMSRLICICITRADFICGMAMGSRTLCVYRRINLKGEGKGWGGWGPTAVLRLNS